jgi:hypothetical protein
MKKVLSNNLDVVELAALVLAAALQIAAVTSMFQELKCSGSGSTTSRSGSIAAAGGCEISP